MINFNFKKNKKFIKNRNGGQIVIFSIILLLFITFPIVFGLISPTVREYNIASANLSSTKSYYLAESGVEDLVYRVKYNINYEDEEILSLEGTSVVTNVISDINNEKTIQSQSNIKNYETNMAVKLITDSGVSFNYGVQVGQGGIYLNSGTINGNAYSNGPITASTSGSNRITGSAISANSPSVDSIISNDNQSEMYDVLFGRVNATQDVAQSFQLQGSNLDLNKIELYVKKVGNPSSSTVTIRNNSNGNPGSTILATGTLYSSLITNNYGWISVVFTSYPTLQANTTYWIVVDASVNNSNYYSIKANNNGYAGGLGKIGNLGSLWSNTTPSGLDYFFKVYLGGTTGLISGYNVWNKLTIGAISADTVKANTVSYVNANGNIYCQNGIDNNKTCISGGEDPVYQEFPVSDGNIEAWRQEAFAGGEYNGNYSVGWAGATLGPKKINGNLTVSSGGTLTLTGNLWVTGNITLNGGAKIQLSPTYGTDDGVIITEGTITVSGGGHATGSGFNGSYLMILTTNTGTSAFSISGGAGAMIAYAPYGGMTVTGGASLKQATAKNLTISGGSSVTYEEGLMDNSFSSGPSGRWEISSWEEE